MPNQTIILLETLLNVIAKSSLDILINESYFTLAIFKVAADLFMFNLT